MILPVDGYNLTSVEIELAQKNTFYDFVLYLSVPLHVFVCYQFLLTISDQTLPVSDTIACILMMGTILGVNGINIGHELGHKTHHKLKQFFAHVLLLTSLQNHFITYHNSGHHRDVATPNDLTSAKEGDNFYNRLISPTIHKATFPTSDHFPSLDICAPSSAANKRNIFVLH